MDNPNSLKNSKYYNEIIAELNYSFGDYFLFDGFVVAEIKEDVLYTWENHGKLISEEISNLYDNDGAQIIYITNRINMYSLKPTDWINFYKMKYNLLGYAIVSYTDKAQKNAFLEKLFMRTRVEKFSSIDNAIEWAKEKTAESFVKNYNVIEN